MATGRRCLANALGRRLITPRGGLFYDPDYGLDVRSYLHAAMSNAKIAELANDIEAECRKDPRVQDIAATVTFDAGARALTLQLVITDATGPFTDVLSIGDVVKRLTA